ncbi:MAG: BatA and WFA domain-containing protein [Taibaiella sp.]|nr:BatA and WFA domain-containing protein [Taibaiella sp.]
MSFLYPLFLAAGVSLAIPVIIHLFNLRKYKTVLFPHTRFLKNIQLNSRKQSQVRYKALLAARLLFLALLVLAFAQPFFPSADRGASRNALRIIYLDNSYSMSARKGARNMLDIAKEAAVKQVQKATPGTRFVLLTNDKPASFHPEQAEKVVAAIQEVELSAVHGNISKVFAAAQGVLQGEPDASADLYYYSDFQQSGFPAPPQKSLQERITFYGIPVQPEEVANVYIDTAFLASPVLQADRSNSLVVRSHVAGKLPDESPVLNLTVNGQVKSAASLDFSDAKERTDTLTFQSSGTGWQELLLTLNDVAMRFDDTFRIAARYAPNLSVLVLNEGPANPYIQAAFRAYNGFRLNQADISAIPADMKQYNLVILNGVTRLGEQQGKLLYEALDAGQTICMFPGRTANIEQLNEGLRQMGDIRIESIDTAVQAASQLQQGSPIVRDLFEKIPDNVQLPVANWHYVLSAGLSSNRQSILAFRNGDPFLAKYSPSRGQLYICATSADLQSGNFPGSYFFTPFLYLMAAQTGSGSVFAVTAGSPSPVYVALANVTERNTVHALGGGTDVIPPQRQSGAGLEVMLGSVVQQPGFYTLAAPGMDSLHAGVNQDKLESLPELRDISALQKEWKGENVQWMSLAEGGNTTASGPGLNFPLWKVCVILALVMLALETWLLTRTKVAVA